MNRGQSRMKLQVRVFHYVQALKFPSLLALYLLLISPDNKKMFKEIKELFKDEKGNKDGSL